MQIFVCLALLFGGIVNIGVAQSVTITQPTANQSFCASGPFSIPIRGTISGGTSTTIQWSLVVGSTVYAQECTQSGNLGSLYVSVPPASDAASVQAVAITGSQRFFGTGRFYGPTALQITVTEAGHNFEGQVLVNCSGNEQDMVIGQRTDNIPVGTTTLIRGFCTDPHGSIPSSGRVFGSPWTSESTSHWAYWEKKAVQYANQNNSSDQDVLAAIWYIAERSGAYNNILTSIQYPVNGPTKNPRPDTTPPSRPAVTDDGDTTSSYMQLHATWTSQEPESGIIEYQYAIGRSAGATDVVNWTSTGGVPEVTRTGLSLGGGLYYFTVKARNGVGLWSEPGTSNGIYVIGGEFNEQTVYNYPNPFSPQKDGFTRIAFLVNQGSDVTINIYNAIGDLVWRKELDPTSALQQIQWEGKDQQGRTVANGIYFCKVEAQGKTVIKKIAVLE